MNFKVFMSHPRAVRLCFCLAVVSAVFVILVALDLVSWSSNASSPQETPSSAKRKRQSTSFVPGEILVRFKASSDVRKSTTRSSSRTLSLATQSRQIDLQIERLDSESESEIVDGLRIAHVA